MRLNEYGSRMAHIDLSAGSVEMRPAPEDWLRKYIGGRGLGVRYVLENGPDVDPLSPENILCFMNGPLSGSEANMSGRWAAVTKSPLTGTVTDSHQGGWTAARLRWAGLDGLIFSGRAERPVYAFVEDGRVELRDASELWGKGVHETIRILKERYGDKDLSVSAIGQAGENRVRFAAWVNEDDRAFGRGGVGAVGGSKQLKAIVIRGARKTSQVADADAWKRVRRKALDSIRDEGNITSPKKGGLSVYGTNVVMNVTNGMGALPTRNSQLTSFGEGAEAIGGEYVVENILTADPTCHACPDGLQEGGGDQRRPLRGPQDGEHRVRVRLVGWRQLRQRGHRLDRQDDRPVQRLRARLHRARKRLLGLHGGDGERLCGRGMGSHGEMPQRWWS